MSDVKFFRKFFGVQGDRQPIPDDLQASGDVSFDSGYGYDYERNPENDPLAKDIGRPEMNWLFGVITEALRQYQTQGTFRYITAEENGGKPYPYLKTARVLYATGGKTDVYESLADNNTSLPTNSTKWARISAGAFVTAARRIDTAAPLTGGGTLAGNLTLALQAASEGDTLTFKNGEWIFGKPEQSHRLLEFYSFRNPALQPGFYPRQGGILENAATLHPEAWQKLQTTEGRAMCLTEAEWQTRNRATWATLADGTKVGWNGIGGVPFYAPDWNTGALRLPDTRGMYAEDAGFDSLGVGDVHGDGIRRITGKIGSKSLTSSPFWTVGGSADALKVSGAFKWSNTTNGTETDGPMVYFNYNNGTGPLEIDTALVAPVAAKNQPSAWGALACVYLGAPK